MDITQLSLVRYIYSMKIDTEKLLTPNSYRLRYDIGRSTVYKHIDEGLLKTVKIDGVIFIVLPKLPNKSPVLE